MPFKSTNSSIKKQHTKQMKDNRSIKNRSNRVISIMEDSDSDYEKEKDRTTTQEIGQLPIDISKQKEKLI